MDKLSSASKRDEIVINDINGYLVRYLDIDDLKDKMSKILITKLDRLQISKTVEQNKSKYIFELYEKLTQSMINI